MFTAKNHHQNGSFGNHLIEILLIDGLGQIKTLSPINNFSNNTYEQFWATVGGMGLTGVILEATFSLIPIKTSKISVNTSRYRDLDNLMDAMVISDKEFQYSVAWIDTLNKNGRGVVTCGNHALPEQLQKNNLNFDWLNYDPKSLTTAPSFLPNGFLNRLTISAFNETWFRKSPRLRKNELQDIATFFHPLDGIKDWNRLYGPKGFMQYQFVVPDSGSKIIKETIEILKQKGVPSFLSVLKRFGNENPAFLSFPKKGWTLAIDIPLSVPELEDTLSELDNKVADAGGRIYLAKDSRQSNHMFTKTYRKLNEWKTIKNKLDPNHKFTSDLATRVGL